MIVEVTEHSIMDAAIIHSLSWQDSHKTFCTPEFVASHTVQRQANYLKNEIFQGKKLFMLIEGKPVGIVSVYNDLIENLYVLPEEQRKGYGTKLFLFAVEQCQEVPFLWVLSNNQRAISLYNKYGFQKTGNVHALSEAIFEEEMKYQSTDI